MHWVCLHLIELNVYVPQISTIYCDNAGATHFYSNPVFSFSHETCCIELLLHLWISGALYVTHVFFENQSFNMLTKPHSFKNRTGPDQLVRPSTDHSSNPVRCIRSEDDWTGIRSSEPAVRSVNQTIQLYIYILQHQNDVVLITPNLTPFLPATSLAPTAVVDDPPFQWTGLCPPTPPRKTPVFPPPCRAPPTPADDESPHSKQVFTPFPPKSKAPAVFLPSPSPQVEHRPRLPSTSPPSTMQSTDSLSPPPFFIASLP